MSGLTTTQGVWHHEPDFKKWRDAATGLVCAIVRHPHAGHLCGYVRIPKGDLLKRLSRYSRIPTPTFFGRVEVQRKVMYSHRSLKGVSVHGGVTFLSRFQDHRLSRGLLAGFDCAHYNDLAPNMSTVFPGVYRDFSYVTREVESLAVQIATIAHGGGA
jgi:hypothetical protein